MAETERNFIQLGGTRGSVERVIHDIKEHVPNRFSPEGEDWSEEYPDLTAWAWLGGKKVPLQSGFRNDCFVWKIDEDYPEDVEAY